MSKSRFDEVMKHFKTQSACKGTFDNPVAEASKLLEINYTMRQVDHQLEIYKSSILENLKGHEASALTLARLEAEREKITISHNKLSDFADNARPQMIKIAEIRNAFLALLNDGEEEQKFDEQTAREVDEAIQKINNERENVLADLETVGESIESLKTELKDITTCITLQKTENDALHASLEQKCKDIIKRNRKGLARYDELLKLQNQHERKTGIKVEKEETFSG